MSLSWSVLASNRHELLVNIPGSDNYWLEMSKNDGSWVQVPGNLSGGWWTGSWTRLENTFNVSANACYQYRIKRGSSGTWYYSNHTWHGTLLAPNAPTNVSASRVSNAQQNISWVNNRSCQRPYASQRIRRWSNVGGWVTLNSSLAGTASSYSDTTTVVDRQYKYAIRASNSIGSSAEVESGLLYTAPARPSNAVAQRIGTDIQVTWENGSTIAAAVRIQRRVNGGTWGNDVVLPGNAISWNHANPGVGIWEYQVRTEVGSGASLLTSSYRVSNAVQAEQPPAAPSNLSPDGMILDFQQAQVFSWVHNPVDGTPQQGYELRYAKAGTAWVTVSGGAESNRSFPPVTFEVGESYNWQVRTKGQHPSLGDWSPVASFSVAARPQVVILSPADDEYVHGFPELTVEWNVVPHQSSYIIRLYDASGEVTLYSEQGYGEAASHIIGYSLKNGHQYRIGLQVVDNTGLWSEETIRIVSVDYLEPVSPTMSLNLDAESASVVIHVNNPDPEADEPQTVFNRIYRVVDGIKEIVASDVPVDGSVTDYIPGIANINTYIAEAVSEIGSIAESLPVEIEINLRSEYRLNSGPAYSDGIKLIFNPQWQTTAGRKTVTHHFAGREYPVSFQSNQKSREIALSALLDVEDEHHVERVLLNNPGPYFYRDFLGRRFFVVYSSPPAVVAAHGRFYRVSVNLIRVEAPHLVSRQED